MVITAFIFIGEYLNKGLQDLPTTEDEILKYLHEKLESEIDPEKEQIFAQGFKVFSDQLTQVSYSTFGYWRPAKQNQILVCDLTCIKK